MTVVVSYKWFPDINNQVRMIVL